MQDHSQEKQTRLASHIRGLRGMVSHRGGWTALRDSPVTFYINWSVVHLLNLSTSKPVRRFDIICAGDISRGMTPPSQHLNSIPEGKSHLELCILEFCALYRSLFYQQVSFMSHLVEPGSLIGSMLAQKETPVLPVRSAVLIYFCAASNDLCHSPSLAEYVGTLEEKLTAQALTREASLVSVLWALITDFETLGLECPERTWLLSRMMYVGARLSADLRHRIEDRLLSFLVTDCRDDLSLPPERLEVEIWQDIAVLKANKARASETRQQDENSFKNKGQL